jgi:group I intron endonuclease
MIDPSVTCGIYALTNNVLGRVYIGLSSKAFARRWGGHVSDLNLGKHCNIELQRDWLELGASAFGFSIIEAFPVGATFSTGLKALERYYITTSKCWLYNATVDIPRYGDSALIAWLRRGDC